MPPGRPDRRGEQGAGRHLIPLYLPGCAAGRKTGPPAGNARFQGMESCGKLETASRASGKREIVPIPEALETCRDGGMLSMEDYRKPAESNSMRSSTGLEANIAGLLCYLIPFLSGLLLLILEKNSRFVKFHAMQAVLTFGALFAAYYVSSIIPLIGGLIQFLIQLLGFVLWILLMVKAYGKEWYRVPLIGEMAESHIH